MALAQLHRTEDNFTVIVNFFAAWRVHFIHVVKTDIHNELEIHDLATQ